MVEYPPSWAPRGRTEPLSHPLPGGVPRGPLGSTPSRLICPNGTDPGNPAGRSMMGEPRARDRYSWRASMMGGPRARDRHSQPAGQ